MKPTIFIIALTMLYLGVAEANCTVLKSRTYTTEYRTGEGVDAMPEPHRVYVPSKRVTVTDPEAPIPFRQFVTYCTEESLPSYLAKLEADPALKEATITVE